MVDVVDRDQLVQLQMVKNGDRRLDQGMLAGMAVHELREPAQAVQSFLSVVLDQRTGPLNEVQSDFLATACQAARRMARRIEDVQVLLSNEIAFSLQPIEVDLLEHAENCVQELEQIAICHRVRVVLDYGDDKCPAQIWADPDRLDQILLNLIENAIRYAAVDSVVRVIIRHTTCDSWAAVVQNETESLVEQDPTEWFSPFRRGRHSRVAGMGLGLTIAEHLARAHGGEIGAQVSGRLVSVGVIFPQEPADRLLWHPALQQPQAGC